MSRSQREIAAALLEVYAFRADRDDEHLMSVGSYMSAVGRRLMSKPLHDKLEAAGCALVRAAKQMEPVAEYTAALRELAPGLADLRRCERCGSWRNHTRACPTLAEVSHGR